MHVATVDVTIDLLTSRPDDGSGDVDHVVEASRNEDEPRGREVIRIQAWPAPYSQPDVIKRWTAPDARAAARSPHTTPS